MQYVVIWPATTPARTHASESNSPGCANAAHSSTLPPTTQCRSWASTNALPAGGSLKEFSFSSKRRRTVVVSKNAKSRFAKTAAQRDPGAGADPSSRLDLSIEVTGLAGTDVEVARFIASMARCPLIQAVELVYSKEKKFQEAVVREFKVNMRLDPNADVLSAEKQRSGALARADGTGPVGEGK